MAVLPRPPSGHVRRSGEAVAIVDLDDGGVAVRRPRRPSRAPARIAAAVAGAALGVAVAVWPSGPSRPAPALPSASAVGTLDAPALAVFGPTDRTLALPLGVSGVHLAAIPDRLLNDTPAARLRIPVLVRGTTGIASIDAPFEIAWTEAGYWYWMRASDLSVAQLVDLASALQ